MQQLTKSPDVAEVTDAVLTASRALVAIAARSLRDVEAIVSLTQYRALVVLAAYGTMRLSDLADKLQVSPPSATRLCDRLVKVGLISRIQSPLDRREVRLAATKRGLRIVSQVTKRRRSEIATILQHLSPDSQREVIQALSAFASVAGEISDRNWAVAWDL